MTRTDTGPRPGTEEPDDHAAVDDLLAALPEPQLAPDRFAAIHAALVHELQHSASNEPIRRDEHLPLAAGLRRLRTTRWRIALSGAALGVLAVALALDHLPGAPHTTTAVPSRLQAILAASWTAPYTPLTGAAATAAQTACVSAFNANPQSFPHVSYSTYNHISGSTIQMAGQQGQVIMITLVAGPDLVNCIEVPAGDGSRSWKAYPNWSAGPGLTDRGVVVPAWAELASLPAGTALMSQGGAQYYPPGQKPDTHDDSGRPQIDYLVGSTSPDVAKVTIQIINPSTGATQEVSQTVSARAFFFWWPPQDGTWTKVTAYAADGRTLGSIPPPPLPTFRPPGPSTSK